MAFPGKTLATRRIPGDHKSPRAISTTAMAEKQLLNGAEEVSLSSMISGLEASLSGEIAKLKQHMDSQLQQQQLHLDSQFQQLQQNNFREKPLRERMDSGTSFDASMTSFDRAAANATNVTGAFTRVVSPGESSVVSGPAAGPTSVPRPPGRSSTTSSRSRRKTFVRTQMLERHITAKRTAMGATVFHGDEDLAAGSGSRTWREVLRNVVLSTYFNFSIIGLIIINAALLGVEIDVAAQVGQEDIPTWLGTVNEILG